MQSDIFLICSNAMQYNAPDTVYFRQVCQRLNLNDLVISVSGCPCTIFLKYDCFLRHELYKNLQRGTLRI